MQFSSSYFFLIILIFGLLNESTSIEWNCNNNTNTGNFTLSNDCVISGNDQTLHTFAIVNGKLKKIGSFSPPILSNQYVRSMQVVGPSANPESLPVPVPSPT